MNKQQPPKTPPCFGILTAKNFSEEAVNSARVVKDLQLVRCKPRYELDRWEKKQGAIT